MADKDLAHSLPEMACLHLTQVFSAVTEISELLGFQTNGRLLGGQYWGMIGCYLIVLK